MNKQQILDTIYSLAQSQGFYSRLYGNIMELDKKDRNNFLQHLENQKFKDSVDLVLFFEC